MRNTNDSNITENLDTVVENIGSLEFAQPQPTAIESPALDDEADSAAPKTSYDVRYITRGLELRDAFRRDVLREDDYCAACTAALEIAEELEASPELIIFSEPFNMARELMQYLSAALFRAAQKAEGIPDSLLSKMNLFKK